MLNPSTGTLVAAILSSKLPWEGITRGSRKASAKERRLRSTLLQPPPTKPEPVPVSTTCCSHRLKLPLIGPAAAMNPAPSDPVIAAFRLPVREALFPAKSKAGSIRWVKFRPSHACWHRWGRRCICKDSGADSQVELTGNRQAATSAGSGKRIKTAPADFHIHGPAVRRFARVAPSQIRALVNTGNVDSPPLRKAAQIPSWSRPQS